MNKVTSKNKITVPAIPDSLPALRKFITQVGERYHFTTHEINAFRISIDEACTNIIKHGYHGRDNGQISMLINADNVRLVVELTDQGMSFDPTMVNNPNVSKYVEKRKKGGLGIFIMRKFLDVIEYEVTTTGNVMRLIKLRDKEIAKPAVDPITAAFKKLMDLFSRQAA
ncbi:hypothetical protein B6I21_08935 [candidate division KSB1 bacterium 4572_119]|nr:MAG: hypothetical protein B6I21_08935 [candidate division KSB1 bacterium 4572_119]